MGRLICFSLVRLRGMALPMKAAMKPAMKAAMKAKKAMKVSKIATGKRARAAVFRGSKEKTGSGVTKDKLVKNKSGKIVAKAASARAKKAFAASPLKKWMEACRAARQEHQGLRALRRQDCPG